MKLEQTYAETFPELAVEARPDIPAESRVSWVNEPLAQDLGLDAEWLASAEGLKWLTGQKEAEPGEGAGSSYALAYSGFQFGHLSPILGDGRAHLIGELPVADAHAPDTLSRRVDLHLKGSGRTPFSRPGSDGKAPLSAVWREVIIGEFFAAMNVPTSRALAVIETGETIRRRSPAPEPAAIVVRVASSHIRVGTFQYAQMNLIADQRQQLVEYSLERHFPHLKVQEQTASQERSSALTLLQAVAEKQADLVAQWMGLGFIHGVLNTDNVLVSGESIDFGPCAFIDQFRMDAVFSSIDQQGRYAFGNQPVITQWNLARFAESLLDLMAENPNDAVDDATAVLTAFDERFQDRWVQIFAAKLGVSVENISTAHREQLKNFIGQTLTLLEKHSLDFTEFFYALTHTPEQISLLGGEASVEELMDWLSELMEFLGVTGTDETVSRSLMEGANPLYIPRNMRVDAALREVEKGNSELVERLLDALRQPMTRRGGLEDLEIAPDNSRFFTSFCGT